MPAQGHVCVRVCLCPSLGLSCRSCIHTCGCQYVNICANICIMARGGNCLGINKRHGNIWSLVPEAGTEQRESRQAACPTCPGDEPRMSPGRESCPFKIAQDEAIPQGFPGTCEDVPSMAYGTLQKRLI